MRCDIDWCGGGKVDAITLIVLIISLTVARHYSTRSLLFPSVARFKMAKFLMVKSLNFTFEF